MSIEVDSELINAAQGETQEGAHYVSDDLRKQLQELGNLVEGLVQDGKTAEAILLLSERCEQPVTYPIYFSLLGKIFESQQKINDSVRVYRAGLVRHPGDAYLIIGLGFVFYNQKDFSNAQMYLQQAWVEDPTNIRLLTAIGNVCKNNKDFKKAIKYYRIASLLEPDNTFAIYGLANCYRGISDYARELEAWLKFLKFEPQNKIALTRVGDCQLKLENYDASLEYYSKALEINYDFYALLGKAKVFQKKGMLSEAREIYDGLGEHDRGNVRFYSEYIHFLADTGKTSDARKEWQKASEMFPSNRYITTLKSSLGL